MELRCSLAVVVSVVFTFLSVVLRPRTSATTICDPQFNDVPSKTLLSKVVFLGRVTQTVTQNEDRRTSNKTFSVVDFSVTRSLKSNVTEETISMIADCSLRVQTGAMYVVFAVNASTRWSVELNSTRLFRVLGNPLQFSRRIERQVVEYACAGCQGLKAFYPSFSGFICNLFFNNFVILYLAYRVVQKSVTPVLILRRLMASFYRTPANIRINFVVHIHKLHDSCCSMGLSLRNCFRKPRRVL